LSSIKGEWRKINRRSKMKQDVSHISLLSQGSARELFDRLMTLPYQGVFIVLALGVLGLLRGLFLMIINQCGSTLFVSMYISFA
jgi:hypothetical protein